MSKLNKDVIFLILKDLSKNRNFLYSCLLVNRIWCETTIPILWSDPDCITEDAKNKLFGIILLHLSEKSREILKDRDIDHFVETSQKPLFNYINFWKHLRLYLLEDMIVMNIVHSKISIVRNEIMKLFNRNTKFTHLDTSSYDKLYFPAGAENCFSELKSLYYCSFRSDDQKVLERLSRISKSVKKLELKIYSANNSGIVKLIEAQNNLNDVKLFDGVFRITVNHFIKLWKNH
jgi:hypothetical protein